MVAQPIADEVRVACIHQYRDLLEDLRYEAVEGLHPVACEQEVAVDIEIATIVAVCLHSQRFQHMRLVQVFRDPVKLLVAKAAAVGALDADVVRVLAAALVGANDGVVAVDAGGDTGPDATAIVAAFDERFAAGEGVIHGLAFAFAEDSRPAASTAGHGAVVVILGEAIRETVADQDGLEINVAFLV